MCFPIRFSFTALDFSLFQSQSQTFYARNATEPATRLSRTSQSTFSRRGAQLSNTSVFPPARFTLIAADDDSRNRMEKKRARKQLHIPI